MTNEEYKVIRVTQATHGYLMDNRTSDLKTMGSVVWGLIEENAKLEAKIKALEERKLIFKVGTSHEMKDE